VAEVIPQPRLTPDDFATLYRLLSRWINEPEWGWENYDDRGLLAVIQVRDEVLVALKIREQPSLISQLKAETWPW
jgi:hypothetical protein